MPIRPNARMLRDIATRQSVASNELIRRAYKYIARNTTLPARVRHQAQLQLNLFPTKARPAAVRNRCVETGRGKGIINEFGLCRFQFRLNALKEQIPGVRKASW
ncbi:40S ribosomal protein mrp2, mitochondrial [Tilletia horrida]|uniref:40S ribosomal protein mrp2, mitochondrial n=1 Tax=Tilletia horrida TaxID=155126 RepID=A0AAN6GH85_9BASI|nr:40S ribosomal protein mrp2, mitochondrial [Tilletia horrida]KAK0525495.1 40S ribosomal protein mrp2, mitochondrial [Tilletia horrida]KAK0533866.1 40S ribosomal protein mrp2, mitochondrial [Tilletia horrida]KAK0562974.1 40S ribosomal protein mrp2, mitochondrial [Tilletia horrida]